jgi:HPr kinase/phosphorylase
VTIKRLLEDKARDLGLTLLSSAAPLDRVITSPEINRVGMALAGYTGVFMAERVQIFGETETSYLGTLTKPRKREALQRVFSFDIPCGVITKGLPAPDGSVEIADARGIPLLSTSMDTTPFVKALTTYLEYRLAPRTTIHGTLMDVYGVGLLYTGKAGMGKSECALDLVERGHRLVADDMVTIIRRADNVLIGTGSELLGHHMEIRGIGIIDVQTLFGIRAIRLQKRVEVEIRLESWDETKAYERLGLEPQTTTIFDVKLPVVSMPVFPGKNISVLSEVIAMNHMLSVYGCSPAKEFNQRILECMRRRSEASGYLEVDTE